MRLTLICDDVARPRQFLCPWSENQLLQKFGWHTTVSSPQQGIESSHICPQVDLTSHLHECACKTHGPSSSDRGENWSAADSGVSSLGVTDTLKQEMPVTTARMKIRGTCWGKVKIWWGGYRRVAVTTVRRMQGLLSQTKD